MSFSGLWGSSFGQPTPNVVNGQRIAIRQARSGAPLPEITLPALPADPVIIPMFDEVPQSLGPGIYLDPVTGISYVETDAIYRVSGFHSLEFAANDELRLFFYVNGESAATAGGAFLQGRGTGKPVELAYTLLVRLPTGAQLDIRGNGEVSPVTLQVDTSNFCIERTHYDPADVAPNVPF